MLSLVFLLLSLVRREVFCGGSVLLSLVFRLRCIVFLLLCLLVWVVFCRGGSIAQLSLPRAESSPCIAYSSLPFFSWGGFIAQPSVAIALLLLLPLPLLVLLPLPLYCLLRPVSFSFSFSFYRAARGTRPNNTKARLRSRKTRRSNRKTRLGSRPPL